MLAPILAIARKVVSNSTRQIIISHAIVSYSPLLIHNIKPSEMVERFTINRQRIVALNFQASLLKLISISFIISKGIEVRRQQIHVLLSSVFTITKSRRFFIIRRSNLIGKMTTTYIDQLTNNREIEAVSKEYRPCCLKPQGYHPSYVVV